MKFPKLSWFATKDRGFYIDKEIIQWKQIHKAKLEKLKKKYKDIHKDFEKLPLGDFHKKYNTSRFLSEAITMDKMAKETIKDLEEIINDL